MWDLRGIEFDFNVLTIPGDIYAGKWKVYSKMTSSDYDGTQQNFCYFLEIDAIAY